MKAIGKSIVFLFVSLFVIMNAGTAAAAGKMYVTDPSQDLGYHLGVANLDGSGGINLGNLNGTLTVPYGIAIDDVHGKIYIANPGARTVSQANLDGTGGIVLDGLSGMVFTPMDVALDITAGKMYVLDNETNSVIQANLDGSGGINLDNLNGTLNNWSSTSIAVDTVHGKIYVANGGTWGTIPSISQANLDGTGGINLGDLNGTLNRPWGIALDLVHGKIYVANEGNNTISQANLDGTGGISLGNFNNTLNYPTDIAVDAAAGKIYITNYYGTVSQGNLDGTVGVSFGNLDGTLVWTRGIALLLPPEVPFASLSFSRFDIRLSNGEIRARGAFTLGVESDGIAPLAQDVNFQVGDSSFNIPFGSFTDNHGNFVFNGIINGASLDVKIAPIGGNNFNFDFDFTGASSLPSANPVTVKLTIGNDGGSTAAMATFK